MFTFNFQFFQVLILAAILAVCRGAAGVVPVAAPYAYARPLGLPVAAPVAAYARPLGVPVAAPVAAYAHPAVARVASVDDYDPNPQYSYAYDIQDALTGKLKRCIFNTRLALPSGLHCFFSRKSILIAAARQ